MNENFKAVCAYLPKRIRDVLLSVPDSVSSGVQEIRLYSDSQIRLRTFGKNIYIGPGGKMTSRENGLVLFAEEMEKLFYKLCGYSVYSCEENLKNGFVTLAGGHRAGICGTAVVREDKVCSVRDVTGITLRISGDFQGGSIPIMETFSSGKESALIFSPPGGGKTTILRDLARNLAGSGKNVSVIDERGEISGWGRYSLHGCDLLLGYPKAHGIFQALRTLSPQVIICDEVGSADEADKISKAFHCGVNFIAAVHAATPGEALRRSGIKDLFPCFDYAVFLKGCSEPGQVDRILAVENLFPLPDDRCAWEEGKKC